MKYFRILFSAAALLLAASCIDNDVPYPVVELRIAGVEGSGFTVSGISIAMFFLKNGCPHSTRCGNTV